MNFLPNVLIGFITEGFTLTVKLMFLQDSEA